MDHGDFTDITEGWNLYQGGNRARVLHEGKNPDTLNFGECVLIHGSPIGNRNSRNVSGFTSIRSRWTDWSPIPPGDDFHWTKNKPAWRKAAIHVHDCAASGIEIIEPMLGENDVIRLVATDHMGKSHIDGVTITRPTCGSVSMHGRVTNVNTGGLPVIDTNTHIKPVREALQ